MKISRRDLFRSTVAVGGAAALGGLGSLSADAVAGTGAVARVAARAGGGTTTRTVVLGKGTPVEGGWRPVIEKPGESYLVRGGLGAGAKKGRAGRRRPVLAFVQLSDVHVVDAQSPMRLEFADEYSSSAYRPQEVLSGHVADAMVRAINDIGYGPVTGRKLGFAIQTGDNADSRQHNEIRWNIDLLDGGTITIDSGDYSKYEGVMDQESASYKTMYWHPEGTPPGLEDDVPRADFGFPVIEGLLDAVRQPFEAEGLAMPWYTAMGNHDGLIQGNFVASPTLTATATGTVKKIDALNTRTVTADADRRIVDRTEWVQEHFTTTGTPVGHGFTQDNLDTDTAYYTFDRGIVRFVVMDTVNANGGDEGSLSQTQFAWIKKTIAASSRKLLIFCSHHPSWSMVNDRVSDIEPGARILGPTLVKELLKHDNVIAWVNGHTHSNNVLGHVRTDKKTKKAVGGFWEINTASHIDWPQQSRLIEITDNKDDTLSIFTTMVDHSGSLEFSGDLGDPQQLAGLSRLLTANDWQERDDHREGRRADRNVELIFRTPAFLR